MLPRGMVGQKCHPPLSTIPEVWRCAAGRQASRSARRGWREIRGNSINGRFLRTRERAQLHTHTHLNARCTHIVTKVTHLWMCTHVPQSVSYTSPTVKGYRRDRRAGGTHVPSPVYNRSVSFFTVSLFWYLCYLTFCLPNSANRELALLNLLLPPSLSLSLRW